MARMFLNKEISMRDLEKGIEFEVDLENNNHSDDESSDENFDDLVNNDETELFSGYDKVIKPRYVSGIIVPFCKLKERMEPITEDGLILKEVLICTAGEVIPDKSVVFVHYDAYLDDRREPFDSTRLRKKPYKFLLGDGNLIPGLEMGIRTMKKGELSRIMVHPSYAYGDMGCPPRIPENAEILYEVQIIKFIAGKAAVEFEEMSLEAQKQASFEKIVGVYHCENQMATDLFRRRMYKPAISRYRRVVNLLQDISVANEEEDKQRNEYLLKLYLNLSICYLNVQNPQKALIYADLALKLDPDNVKGLFRMGKALYLAGSYDRAEHYLHLAKKQKPFDKSITQAIKELEKKRKVHKDWEKMFCEKMLGSGETKLKSDVTFEEPADFVLCIEEQMKEFLQSEEMEFTFPPSFNESQLEVVKHFARTYDLAFVSKIVDGEKLNKIAKRKCS
ncbi:inactive peptidyl-prolyl cis-trans isomerase FKBP6 [Trichonephila clavata]|uniref:peptidylprolyl isomerase n=1 Tax=Trichonephila clavata TaxID=2740835 RepID=A0A8X6K3R9_TRICU|nr:inactive peptidyl-prolyl cis-trans isomerase FKBP6 [Trichonephila clavata]